MKKIGLLLILSCFLLGCKATQNLKNIHWLSGTWYNQEQRLYETWTAQSKSQLNGTSYQINQKDTLVFETISLIYQGKNWLYIPTVKNQNNGNAVIFSATKASKNQLIFENLQHDFPQQITYTKINNDSLVAKISGKKNNEIKEYYFEMQRIE